MGELEGFPVVDVSRPHGFLIWRGKQTAIASPIPLPAGQVMITSDGEAFGVATLSQPAQMSLSEFEREEQAEKHRIRPEERKMLFPKADTFYIHTIKAWKGYNEPQPIIGDSIAFYEPTPEEASLIEKSKRLPKTIIIHPQAITLTGGGFVAMDGVKSEELSISLEAIFGEFRFLDESEGDAEAPLAGTQAKALPLYQLALVRRPTLRFEDVKKKELTMPYELNDDDCVVNIDTGEIEKCHDTHEEALAHLQALNIAYVEEEKALTKTEDGSQFSRSAYLFVGNPDEVSTWKLRIEAEPGQVTKAQLGAAAAALSSGGFRGQRVSISSEDKAKAAKRLISEYRKLDVADDDIPDHLWSTAGMKPAEKAGRRLASTWIEKLRMAKDVIQELMGWAEYVDREEEVLPAFLVNDSGIAIKMVNGEPWHTSWSSNAFEDRDGEIFSLKSLEQYVRENEENEVKGWFNLWHIPHTDFAEKRYQAIIGKFLFEAGPYLKDEKGQKALAFFKEHSAGHPEIAPEGWGSSVEYKYLPEERKEKIYQWTWITRTSTLARGAAANIWTKAMQKESIMTDEQRKAAVAIFGEEFTNQLVGTGERSTKELEEAGVANKQATEGEPVTETPPAAAPVEETPVETPVVPDTTQVVTDLAAQMMTNINEALTPVLTQFQQQIQGLGEQVKMLSDDLKALKGEQAIKEKVELPRFTFDMIRASQAHSTAVPEGDSLKDKKPLESTVDNGGSVAASYFQSAKR